MARHQYKYHLENYDRDDSHLGEFHKEAVECESRFGGEAFLDLVAMELSEYEYHNCDGWDWWKQGKQYPMYIWDINDVYLGKCMVTFEMEPSFYARQVDGK